MYFFINSMTENIYIPKKSTSPALLLLFPLHFSGLFYSKDWNVLLFEWLFFPSPFIYSHHEKTSVSRSLKLEYMTI